MACRGLLRLRSHSTLLFGILSLLRFRCTRKLPCFGSPKSGHWRVRVSALIQQKALSADPISLVLAPAEWWSGHDQNRTVQVPELRYALSDRQSRRRAGDR